MVPTAQISSPALSTRSISLPANACMQDTHMPIYEQSICQFAVQRRSRTLIAAGA